VKVVAVLSVALLAACGSRTELAATSASDASQDGFPATAPPMRVTDASDVTAASDADLADGPEAAPDSADGDSALPFDCTTDGTFFELSPGTGALRYGCVDSGPDLPHASSALCGEDYPCLAITACGNGDSLVLRSSWGTFPSDYLLSGSLDESDGGVLYPLVTGTITFARPTPQGLLAGTYSATFETLDGGARLDASGRFCVLSN
jgi:hypothetical protein